MPACPEGHRSDATDYCDVCGVPIASGAPPVASALPRCPACGAPADGRFCEACGHDSALPAPPPQRPVGAASTAPPRSEGTTSTPPQSRSPESAEVTTPPSRRLDGPEITARASAVAWIAMIAADRGCYERMLAREGPDARAIEFPAYYPPRRITLREGDTLIGKRSESQGVRPDIDLGLAPADAGVSRTHALLHLNSAGLTVTDLGSTNGTSLNDSDDLIPADRPVPLRSGDRIHVGAWTTITVTAEFG
ncbi:FHA domain-containing protein [Nocardia puris]|uniref:FHA domain-containing protein n=1 Tax=Nocardia puris TaxID=208602 RepID=A0A366DVG8_9NOCA|nr:FHA domain-containing protein [Nocardia puris]MBF6210636.1 FHA domain-containing protein [Nocardia puris]MBF6369362.1 FHA domain-containing protein [Nocardia puris]MBF6457897.1 FHA domain-containing protein [Nocardia puris]RBO94067.1 FHA domain-containing protein [Nocardia puris]